MTCLLQQLEDDSRLDKSCVCSVLRQKFVPVYRKIDVYLMDSTIHLSVQILEPDKSIYASKGERCRTKDNPKIIKTMSTKI